jgi:hypothetical protein
MAYYRHYLQTGCSGLRITSDSTAGKSGNATTLFNDLRKLAANSEDQHHFMATIVCHRTIETKDVGASQYRVYDVVNGQQRLTTLILLLKSIELALPQSSEDRQDLAKTLVKRDGHLILLQTNNANEFIFNRFIREGIAPSRAETQTYSDRNLANAIRDCKQFVESWALSRDVLALMRLVLHRLGFVVFDTDPIVSSMAFLSAAWSADCNAPSWRMTRCCSMVANTGLIAEGLSSPAACQWLIQTSPTAGAGRSWLVTAITTTSGRALL